MEGLDDLGGGRVYANRDEMVRGEARNMMSRMDPRALQRPETYGPAASHFRSRGQELPPSQMLALSSSRSSVLGIVLEPNMPLTTLTPTKNVTTGRVLESTLASQNGQVTQSVFQSRTRAGRRAAGPTQSSAQPQLRGPLSQRVTASPTQPAKNPSAAGTLLDRKREDAVFEAQVKYIKGGGTDLNKFVWAIVLLSPTEPPYMGHFILFVKKNDVYNLELNILLNIIKGKADNNNQVVLRLNENEFRRSFHRLVFQDGAQAKDFLGTIDRLMSGRVENAPSATPIVAAVATSEPVRPAIVTTQNATKANKTVKPAVVATQNTTKANETGMVSTNTVTVSQSNGVKEKAVNGQRTEANIVAAKPDPADLLSGPEDVPPALPADTLHEARPVAAPTPDHNGQATTATSSVLFDLDFSPLQAGNAHSSNMDLLSGVNPWYISDSDRDKINEGQDPMGGVANEPNPWSTSSAEDDKEIIDGEVVDGEVTEDEVVIEDEKLSEDEPLIQGQDDRERMHQSLVTMLLTLLAGFDTMGTTGNTPDEVNRTISTCKQTVANTIRSLYASDPSYFENLTEQEKHQVIDDFLASPVASAIEVDDTQEESAAQAGEEEQVAEPVHAPTSVNTTDAEGPVAEPGNAPSSVNTTTVDPRPSRRVEYSQQQLLNARPNAVPPPKYLGELDFLPPAPRREPAREPVKNAPVTAPGTTTSVKPGSKGIEHRPVSVKPLGDVHTQISRPATPLTPQASPSRAFVKLEAKFQKLSLEDKPVASQSEPAVKVEKANPSVKQRSVTAPVKSTSALNVKTEKHSSSVKQSTPVNQGAPQVDQAPLAERKLNTNIPAPTGKTTEHAAQAPIAKTKEAIQRELKMKVHGIAAFNFSEQRQPTNATTPAAVNTENVQPIAAPPVAQTNGHSNGQLTSPGRLDPQARAFQPRVTDQQTGPRPQVDRPAPAGGPRGLGNSRWATPASTKVESEGKFTGLGFEKKR